MRFLYTIGASISTMVFIVLIGTIAYHNLEGQESIYDAGLTGR